MASIPVRLSRAGLVKPKLGSKLICGHPANTECIARWALNEGGGDTIHSLGPQRISGSLQGTAGWVDSSRGRVLTLSSDTDYVDFGDRPELYIGLSDLTVEAWIKTTTDASQYIMRNGAYLTDQAGWCFLYGKTLDDLNFWISDGTTKVYGNSTGGLTFEDGLWHHVCASVVRSGNVYFYLDGSPVGSESVSALASDDIGGDLDFTIGYAAFDGWNGEIASAGVYRRAFTESEVKSLYANSFQGIQEPGSIALSGVEATETHYFPYTI